MNVRLVDIDSRIPNLALMQISAWHKANGDEVGFKDSGFLDALYRCQRLKEEGTNAYVMRYTRTPKLNALARWANARQLFWSMDFADYTRKGAGA